jgi:hypothetical protein
MRHLMIATVLVGTGLLAGCGNDSDNETYSNANTDSFIQSTENVIATPNADTTTAISIDNIVETSPDTTDPVPVAF